MSGDKGPKPPENAPSDSDMARHIVSVLGSILAKGGADKATALEKTLLDNVDASSLKPQVLEDIKSGSKKIGEAEREELKKLYRIATSITPKR